MNGEYWQPEIETMPREKLRQLQTEKLRRTIETALNSPFYGHRLGKLGITPQSINSVDDIRKIPFTTKQDLRDNYPFGLVAGNMKDAIRIHSSSGTTGHPTVVVYSRHDIDSWANRLPRYRRLPEQFRLRNVYRRTWLPIRGRKARGNDHTGSRRKQQKTNHVHTRLRHNMPACHPKLCRKTG